MIRNNIETLIAEAMKNKDTVRLSVLRLIKTEFVKAEKDGKNVDEATEAVMLTKMVAQREDAIKQFTEANRNDLVEEETAQLQILKEFAPKAVSEEEIKEALQKMVDDGLEPSMKNMKEFISRIKIIYPTANGKIVSDFIKSLG
jgi:uncharacterized protein YqeY